jgi:hypothetical protein
MTQKIRLRRGSSAVPTLAAGELGFRLDSGELFVGNGVSNLKLNTVSDQSFRDLKDVKTAMLNEQPVVGINGSIEARNYWGNGKFIWMGSFGTSLFFPTTIMNNIGVGNGFTNKTNLPRARVHLEGPLRISNKRCPWNRNGTFWAVHNGNYATFKCRANGATYTYPVNWSDQRSSDVMPDVSYVNGPQDGEYFIYNGYKWTNWRLSMPEEEDCSEGDVLLFDGTDWQPVDLDGLVAEEMEKFNGNHSG